MDVYLYHHTVTDVPLYNCSAIINVERNSLKDERHPVRGVASFTVGFPMILVYIACLRVMVTLRLVQKSCYKIMFVIGLYEIITVLLNDIFFAYVLTFGAEFCDAPNVFYTVGCLYTMCWAGNSYLCLYLALNRIVEILQFRRQFINFLFSSVRTTIGILTGVAYSMLFLFFSTPPIFSNEASAAVPNPLGFEILSHFEMRFGLVKTNNCGVVTVTVILYGVFCLIFRKKVRQLGFQENQNRSRNQVFIQSTMMCGFNFFVASSYTLFIFLGEYVILLQSCFFIYQFTTGLQALIYLLCNQTILDGVKEDLFGLLGIEHEATTDMRTKKSTDTQSSQPEGNTVCVPENKICAT